MAGAAPPGLHPLGLAAGRDGLLQVPVGRCSGRPAPLVLMLHGAGGDARQGIGLLRARADAAGFVLVAPDSRDRTWDLVLGGYGADVAFLDEALRAVFDRCAVDAARVAVGGFSDGASYALSVGLANGDLFTHVIAFSPGFAAPSTQVGAPRVFVSHGVRDSVLPIASTSRRVVPVLAGNGYDVRYREFDGGHAVPDEVVGEALAWFAGEEDDRGRQASP